MTMYWIKPFWTENTSKRLHNFTLTTSKTDLTIYCERKRSGEDAGINSTTGEWHKLPAWNQFQTHIYFTTARWGLPACLPVRSGAGLPKGLWLSLWKCDAMGQQGQARSYIDQHARKPHRRMIIDCTIAAKWRQTFVYICGCILHEHGNLYHISKYRLQAIRSDEATAECQTCVCLENSVHVISPWNETLIGDTRFQEASHRFGRLLAERSKHGATAPSSCSVWHPCPFRECHTTTRTDPRSQKRMSPSLVCHQSQPGQCTSSRSCPMCSTVSARSLAGKRPCTIA